MRRVAARRRGCATFDPPKPWEKGDLARPSMRFDADPLEAKATQHIYQSKEGAARRRRASAAADVAATETARGADLRSAIGRA